ncbi:hypothetical protein AB9P05_00100 [Roseivirga sp. BDSF3-8]|uniref:hypothetical protein n=1 Tax=Roseivirga sp. BDSF3-8 TaxID=3241598 RepID=UPI0035317F80
MNKTNENASGVRGIVNEAKILNPEIGVYKEHFINDRFRYIVRLSNGRVEMSREIAQDFELQRSKVTRDRIKKVADSYSSI